ncbi:MAG: dihydrofolate reductase family protein, partial [Planctomycetota bacterium]|nr:dihydrofolate reductase family protein [Planctomycetota bacterium]
PVIQEIEIQEAEKMGATIHRIQETESTRFIDSALQSLGQQEMTNVLVEAGGELLGSLSDAGSIDEIHVYLGSMIVGNQEALSPLGGKGSSEIQHATRLQLEEVKTFGDNIKLTYRV